MGYGPVGRTAVELLQRGANDPPRLQIFVRAHYISEHEKLETHRATAVCYEEAEVAVRLAEMLLTEIGVDAPRILEESLRIRAELGPGVRP